MKTEKVKLESWREVGDWYISLENFQHAVSHAKEEGVCVCVYVCARMCMCM